jgi:hypothetical protein
MPNELKDERIATQGCCHEKHKLVFKKFSVAGKNLTPTPYLCRPFTNRWVW